MMNKYMFVWHKEQDDCFKLYATIDGARQYEVENNVKIIQGARIETIFNTKTGEAFSVL